MCIIVVKFDDSLKKKSLSQTQHREPIAAPAATKDGEMAGPPSERNHWSVLETFDRIIQGPPASSRPQHRRNGYYMTSVKRKRKIKMNKHKYEKV